jgi:hypothetical protein
MFKNVELPFGVGAKIFLTLLLLIFCFACKSVKTNTNTELHTDSIVNTDISAKVDETQNEEQISILRDQSQLSDESSETITEILWSVPDSSGEQYMVKKTTTVRTRNARKAVDVTHQETGKARQKKRSTLSEKTKMDTEHKAVATVSTKTKVTSPGFISWSIVLITVAVIVFVYLFLRSKKFF